MRFSHVLVTRPRQEAEELAAMLTPLGLQVVLQPAFEFRKREAASEQPRVLAALERDKASRLLIFTSTRAVKFGLAQLPRDLVQRQKIAAIGPATCKALKAAGVQLNVHSSSGFTSEALLDTLEKNPIDTLAPDKSAIILAAPGGRRMMEDELTRLGWAVETLMVYSRDNADLDKQALARLSEAEGIFSVWTSGNAMKALSQRLPPATWFQICQGEWLVISERLKRLARAYGPAVIHLSPGPGNSDILGGIRAAM
jgi:uroporphyrinogen-III synthase